MTPVQQLLSLIATSCSRNMETEKTEEMDDSKTKKMEESYDFANEFVRLEDGEGRHVYASKAILSNKSPVLREKFQRGEELDN
jgi:hypothetical protein